MFVGCWFVDCVMLWCVQGEKEKAKELGLQALEIAQDSLGPDHQFTQLASVWSRR